MATRQFGALANISNSLLSPREARQILSPRKGKGIGRKGCSKDSKSFKFSGDRVACSGDKRSLKARSTHAKPIRAPASMRMAPTTTGPRVWTDNVSEMTPVVLNERHSFGKTAIATIVRDGATVTVHCRPTAERLAILKSAGFKFNPLLRTWAASAAPETDAFIEKLQKQLSAVCSAVAIQAVGYDC